MAHIYILEGATIDLLGGERSELVMEMDCRSGDQGDDSQRVRKCNRFIAFHDHGASDSRGLLQKDYT